ncbi:MAG: OadG family protein [Oscillospiraceae bacterium]|jgi:Na+-transporting methylmalonyl-CoA/oxaloacetate decarboxylase gamma subunit|nr:OadG family protein [Oscillospiraceae bacterium]
MLTELSMLDGLLISLLGIVIVFAALLFIVVIIKLVSLIARTVINADKDGSARTDAAEPVTSGDASDGKVPAAGSLGEIALYDTDEQTAALIMAIVADELQAPLNELRFISIRQKV